MLKKIRVWDLPTRLFHWVLVLLVVTSVVTQQIGGNAMEWHFFSGYSILTLLLFRLVWGLIGSRYARFKDFLYSPAAIIAYLKAGSATTGRSSLGHNPVGSLSVLALLGILLAQAMTGLFANDDIASEGPLVRYISKDRSDWLTWLHADIFSLFIYGLVGLHVAAIAYYYFGRKENLVKPMLTGNKEIAQEAPAASDSWKLRLGALLVLAVCAGAVYALVQLTAYPSY